MKVVLFVLALVVLAMSACTSPTAPTQRNPDGSVHAPGSPLQPWINSDVQTGDFHLPTP